MLLWAGIANATTPVSGNLKNLNTVGASGNYKVKFELRSNGLPNCGSRNIARVLSSGVIADSSYLFPVDATGAWSGTVFSNNVDIDCAGSHPTYYHISVLSGGQATSFGDFTILDGVSFNLNNATPNTTFPVVSAPTGDSTYCRLDGGNFVGGGCGGVHLAVVAFSATPVFNASSNYIFDLTLTGNVTSSTLNNTYAGEVVTFILIQDGTGSRTFAWPANVFNASDINPAANSITTQSFIARANGNLYPVGPAVYS